MALTQETIAALAPDQPSLKAAAQQMKPAKWPLRARADVGDLVWGECQGSGANPYRVVFDAGDQGYKCTCPSRKFPCKHVLALMLMFVADDSPFARAPTPDWVSDWVGRRRKTDAGPAEGGAEATAAPPNAGGKSVAAALAAEKASGAAPQAAADPKQEARRRAAAAKRAAATEASIRAALDELELWIADQLRAGLGELMADLSDRCRSIAARMVDGKAGALAGRIDEAPARVLALRSEERIDALIQELGKLVLLARAWRNAPDDPELRRAVATAETRDEVLAHPAAPRARALWEVLGEQISTRRDGLVAQATWLLNLSGGERLFGLLLDFFPASAGRRGGAFAAGERFEAELVFYPARHPLRAVIAERRPAETAAAEASWPDAPTADPLGGFADLLQAAPWSASGPVLLPEGRLAKRGDGALWWRSADGAHALPIDGDVAAPLRGMRLTAAAAVWTGARLQPLAARSDWGRLSLHG